MIFSNFKKKNHKNYLKNLAKIPQLKNKINIFYDTKSFRKAILNSILNVKRYIYITALYFEKDNAGKNIMNALYKAKVKKPKLDIKIIVDLHRSKRGKIGEKNKLTNAQWYYEISKKNPNINIPIFGVPINTREIFGVLHLKGFIFDNVVIYSGASINNSYLQQNKYYRYDRYHLLNNNQLAKTMKLFIDENLLSSPVIQRLDKFSIKKRRKNFLIKRFRSKLKKCQYKFENKTNNKQLSVTPLVGLGRKNILNKTIVNLMKSTEKKMIICTPYFNLPNILIQIIIKLLKNKKKIEIIIGDKTSNDFYKSPKKPFKIINVLPYLYEINLFNLTVKLQNFIDKKLFKVRIWKNKKNSYHLKGIWIDEKWQLITGNNLNPRSWHLDLENAILIHDPKKVLKKKKELKKIKKHSRIIKNSKEIENIEQYPLKVKKIIKKIYKTHLYKLIRFFL